MIAKKTPAKSKSLAYARAGGPPDNWAALEVVSANGDITPMANVIEVDTLKGWVVRYRSEGGRLVTENGALVTERVKGHFTIRVRR